MLKKFCKTCKQELPTSEFNSHSETRDKLRTSCKNCRRLENKNYRDNNRDRVRQYERDRDKTPYKTKKLASDAKRRAAKLKATPSWLSETDYQEILDFYIACKMFQAYTGIEYHVDHIVPLCGKNVCGLHVPWNLQILEAKENMIKNNQF